MKKSDFHYELPEALIAQVPLPERSASRLLLVSPGDAALSSGEFADMGVRDLPSLLQPGDLLVFNDTRVIPARLFGNKATGGRVEILIERLLANNEARAQLGVSKSPKPGSRIALDAGGEAEVLARDDAGFWHLRFHLPEPLENWLLHAGRLPLPPYIQREPGADDAERYQTVFAREIGAVAAPTAGLHFDDALLDGLRERGVQFGHVTLHVGAGTFQPVRVNDVHQHRMHSEWINVGAELVQQVRRTCATSSAPTLSHSLCMVCWRTSSTRTGWNVPAPTCKVTWPNCTPRSRNVASSASSKCRPAVGAATAPTWRANTVW